jgi:hypothetical protein
MSVAIRLLVTLSDNRKFSVVCRPGSAGRLGMGITARRISMSYFLVYAYVEDNDKDGRTTLRVLN